MGDNERLLREANTQERAAALDNRFTPRSVVVCDAPRFVELHPNGHRLCGDHMCH